jgi:signal transduction histidine kinase
VAPTRSVARDRAALLLLDDGIARLALLALAERDVQRLLERAVVCIGEALAVEHVQVFELLPDGTSLVSRAALGGDRRSLSLLKLERPEDSQASFTLHTHGPVVALDLPREARFNASRTQRAHGVVTAVSVPLFGRSSRPFGVLEIGTSGPSAVPAERVVDFLQGAGHLLVPAVERARVLAAARFLAESESRLVSAQGFTESVVALAEIAVPRLADWCCIDLVLPTGAIECVAVAHSDSSVTALASTLRSRLQPDPKSEAGVAQVVRTGLTEFHFDLGAALSLGSTNVDALGDLVDAAGFRAAIVTPLAARGHVFGAVTLVAHNARRLFDEGDVLMADAFAAHAGLALDNVRLFFGQDTPTHGLPPIAGVTSGIALVDSELMGTRLLSTVADEKNRLARVVQNVVLASRLSSDTVAPDDSSCDTVEVVRRVVDGFRGALPDGWTVDFAQPSVRSVGAAETIGRIVTCLVDNAATYSPEGGAITVRVETSGTSVRVLVEDDGIGIPPEERERVFEKFQRGEGIRDLGADGVGLGLYICRELATRLRGHVGILDERGRGTTVYVELPLAGAGAGVLSEDGGERRKTAARRRTKNV